MDLADDPAWSERVESAYEVGGGSGSGWKTGWPDRFVLPKIAPSSFRDA
jgi:hypothetical protein